MLILCSLGCVGALVIYMGKLSVEKVCDDERLREEKNKEREVSRRLLEGRTKEARERRDTLLRDIRRSLLEIKDKTRLSVAALKKKYCAKNE